jgi:hypothetical protein
MSKDDNIQRNFIELLRSFESRLAKYAAQYKDYCERNKSTVDAGLNNDVERLNEIVGQIKRKYEQALRSGAREELREGQ